MTCALPMTANWLEGLDCGVDLRVLGLVRSWRSYQISAGAKLLLDSQLALVNVVLRIVFPERHSLMFIPVETSISCSLRAGQSLREYVVCSLCNDTQQCESTMIRKRASERGNWSPSAPSSSELKGLDG